MKTKFILHGGSKINFKKDSDSFFKEVLKDTPINVKILLVYFAKEQEKISASKKEYVSEFEKNRGNKTLSFEVADEKLFIDQIKTSDVVYFLGGKTSKILNTAKKFKNLKKSFENKTVVAESAGVDAISAFFYDQIEDSVLEGTGLIQFKTICHYSAKLKDKIDYFDGLNSDLGLLLLPEYKYQVFYQ